MDLTKATTRENVLGGGATATAAEKGQYKLKCGFNKNDLGLYILFIYSTPLDPFGRVNLVLVFETKTKLNIF